MSKTKALPKYEAEVWEYADRVVGLMTCNLCGVKFSVELKANPEAIAKLSRDFKVNRLFVIADRRHSCPDDSLPVDDKETDKIVNVYHETKRRLVGRGLVDAMGNAIRTHRSKGKAIRD